MALAPWILLPTAQLRFSREPEEGLDALSAKESPTAQVTAAQRRRGPLSAEDSASIYSYIRAHNKDGQVRWPKPRKELPHADEPTGASESADGRFYLPALNALGRPQAKERSTLVGHATTLLKDVASGALDAVGLASLATDPPLTLEILMLNNVSVRALIDVCRVPMTNLYDAGVVSSFRDLQDLHFHPRDLLRKRELFQASALPQLFKTSFSGMRSQNCAFGLGDLKEQVFKATKGRRERKAKFYSSELEALSVSLDSIIREDAVTARDLIELNYELPDLERLGFEREHLTLLGITRKQALEPWPAGFGWSRDEYRDLCES